MSHVRGLHHVTAIARSARGNLAFWRDRLGLRLVKRTVNFDDPSGHHLYYGDRVGRPGSLITFFVWERVALGRRGVGDAAEIQLAVPPGSLAFWRERLARAGLESRPGERFDGPRLVFRDPDGVEVALVESAGDDRPPWPSPTVPVEVAIRGLHGVTLALADPGPTAALLADGLDYRATGASHDVRRLEATGGGGAPVVDLVTSAAGPARPGAGSVHHVAFAVADRAAQDAVRERLVAAGHSVTPPIDRDYFHAIYVRSPGGVLFEVATATPGFTVDEPVETLGTALRLPRRYAHRRAEIERRLPPLDQPSPGMPA